MMPVETIYVYLVDEGVDCWRPVEALNEGAEQSRMVSANPNPIDERQEFTTGELVTCERRLSGGNTLRRSGTAVGA